jgi:hypothetical protein
MKWFFAFNQDSVASYGDFVKVAVNSALKRTQLEPICLYDGANDDFTTWLEARGVTIWPTQFRFAAQLDDIGRQINNPALSRIAKGTFLRLELPRLAAQNGLRDEVVLYTDCDVLFLGDVEAAQTRKPQLFAVAPELWPTNYLHMNAGVMLLNLPAMQHEEVPWMAFVARFLRRSFDVSFDQGLLRVYFNPLHRLSWKFGLSDRLFYAAQKWKTLPTYRWNELPLEWNWKPYWGENSETKILHFHGPKPQQRVEKHQNRLAPHLVPMANHHWDCACALWDAELKSIN